MTTTAAVTRKNKARGLLLAAAVGDAMGAPFKGRTTVEEADLLAEHLAARRDDTPLEEDVLAEEFARTWRAEPWRGYGTGAAEIFRLVNAGVSWRQATRALFQGQGSYGNGAAMRAAPVALVARPPSSAAPCCATWAWPSTSATSPCPTV